MQAIVSYHLKKRHIVSNRQAELETTSRWHNLRDVRVT
jgi:hypothetical protein